MLTPTSLKYAAAVGVLFGSFYAVNLAFGGVGVLIAGAVTALYFLNTGAAAYIARMFEWATGLITGTPTG